jgi:Domain of unknown function (DUF1905)
MPTVALNGSHHDGRLDIDFRMSLYPWGEFYLVPVKDAIGEAEGLTLGDRLRVRLDLDA